MYTIQLDICGIKFSRYVQNQVLIYFTVNFNKTHNYKCTLQNLDGVYIIYCDLLILFSNIGRNKIHLMNPRTGVSVPRADLIKEMAQAGLTRRQIADLLVVSSIS